MTIRYGSLFSGIGGFDLGFDRAGMECAWQVEWDDKARGVLAKHWPAVDRSVTDVREVTRDRLDAVDLICGGFPCQDVSVAGKRAGLAGERSGLWFEFHRILAEFSPEWVVIENVPGLLSSNGGADFAVILRGLAELRYGVAWRVLDSQYFGVPQRRRRVFIVGSLGSGRSAEVLFERESGAGDIAAGREKGEGIAGTLDAKSASSNRGSQANEHEFIVPVTYNIQQNDGGGHKRKDRPNGGMYVNKTDVSLTVGSTDQTFVSYALNSRNNRLDAESQTLIAAHETGKGFWTEGLPGLRGQPGGMPENIVAIQHAMIGRDRGGPEGKGWRNDGKAWTLDGRGEADAIVSHNYQGVGVRRLTPTECERLQGFPDGWTAGQADTPRYKQLGNAVTVNVAEWIGRQLIERMRGRDDPAC